MRTFNTYSLRASLVWEDPTCRGATKPVRHNYWACVLEPVSHNYWARVPQLLKPARRDCWGPCTWSPCSTAGEATAVRSPPAHCSEEWPPLATTREGPHAAVGTQCSQGWIGKIKKKKEDLLSQQLSTTMILHYGELYNYFIIYYNVIIIEIKCTINIMCLNHPETIPPALVRGKIVFHPGDRKGWGPLL